MFRIVMHKCSIADDWLRRWKVWVVDDDTILKHYFRISVGTNDIYRCAFTTHISKAIKFTLVSAMSAVSFTLSPCLFHACVKWNSMTSLIFYIYSMQTCVHSTDMWIGLCILALFFVIALLLRSYWFDEIFNAKYEPPAPHECVFVCVCVRGSYMAHWAAKWDNIMIVIDQLFYVYWQLLRGGFFCALKPLHPHRPFRFIQNVHYVMVMHDTFGELLCYFYCFTTMTIDMACEWIHMPINWWLHQLAKQRHCCI